MMEGWCACGVVEDVVFANVHEFGSVGGAFCVGFGPACDFVPLDLVSTGLREKSSQSLTLELNLASARATYT